MSEKIRLDNLLVDRELAPSRSRARALIMAGHVLVEGRPATKAGENVAVGSSLELRGGGIRFASRGGEKLEHALERFGLDVAGMVALDIGASTGGFTDCLLQRGAEQVYAVDVGYGQLAWKLRNDPRIINLERTNARDLKPADIGRTVDLTVIDVSFISLELILPPVSRLSSEGGVIVALIKPQFEVGKGQVGKGGVVREPAKHRETLLKVARCASALGLSVRALTRSPLKGPKGNIEFFIHLVKGLPVIDNPKMERMVEEAVYTR